ncbi:MAG: hypothetical protein AUK09_02515 [Parcubacteria group bacterium CG2_30_36_38]|nr:MAG: hypothetical protein AUK09_02515 [Parcubacteria group bacterium CG2_30_36_38]
MKQATLCLLIKRDSKEILLAMKKRGFGVGKWNGVGGKFDEIPLLKMWDDDKFWLPHVLQGKKLKAEFVFNKEEKISQKLVEIVKNF